MYHVQMLKTAQVYLTKILHFNLVASMKWKSHIFVSSSIFLVQFLYVYIFA